MFLLPAAQFRLRLWTSIKTWRQTLSIIFWGSVSSVIQTPTWNHKNAQHCLIISSQGLWFKRGIGEAGEGCPVGIWEGHQGTCDTPSFPNDIQMTSKWYLNDIQIWYPWSFPARVAGRASTISMDSSWFILIYYFGSKTAGCSEGPRGGNAKFGGEVGCRKPGHKMYLYCL